MSLWLCRTCSKDIKGVLEDNKKLKAENVTIKEDLKTLESKNDSICTRMQELEDKWNIKSNEEW